MNLESDDTGTTDMLISSGDIFYTHKHTHTYFYVYICIYVYIFTR